MTTNALPALPGGEVIVYESEDGEARVDVRFDKETVWLTRLQMAELFGRDRSVITRHINNAYREQELDSEATCAKFAQVRFEGGRQISRDVEHYNLDVIISVGYRVKSLRGTQFRIWATRTLREHLVSGYTVNERRLAERGLDEAKQTLDLLARTLSNQALVDETGRAVLHIITAYADTWRLDGADPADRGKRAVEQGSDDPPHRESHGRIRQLSAFSEFKECQWALFADRTNLHVGRALSTNSGQALHPRSRVAWSI